MTQAPRWWPQLRTGSVEPLLPALLLALTVVESRLPGRFPGPTAAWVAAMLVATVPLVWRRRWPVLALVLGTVALDVHAFVVGVPQSAGMFLTSLLATYVAAAHGSVRGRAVGVTVLLIGIPAYLSQDPAVTSVALALPTVVIQAAAWGTGATVRRRQERAREAEAAAAAATEAALHAAADERLRIAHDLHDVVAHGLSVMVIQAATARVAWERGDPLAGEAMRAVEATGREALGEMRRLLDVLRPDGEAPEADGPPLGVGGTTGDRSDHAPIPGLGDLGRLAEHLRPTGVHVELSLECDASTVPPALQASLYRIAQEALTNVVKHVGPTSVQILVSQGNEQVTLRVQNAAAVASRLPSPRVASGGRGLVHMRERAAAFGGVVEAGPVDGGYRVEARMPLVAA